MTSLQFLSQLIEQYGLYAVFFLVMIEGDITLLLAGVLAHSAFFGDSNLASFARVLLWGTLGGVASDNLAYFAGRGFGTHALSALSLAFGGELFSLGAGLKWLRLFFQQRGHGNHRRLSPAGKSITAHRHRGSAGRLSC